ncbi:MAG: arylsulfatase A-like enzyme [Rubritalea sp.]|jgi:arylsulfatase A-like enzyme
MNKKNSNKWCLSALLIAGMALSALPVQAKETTRPNVLFFFTDDQRHDTIYALGNEAIRTPHIDSLVKNGVAFSNAYIMGGSSPAVCSPSRACLFSGLTLWNVENQGLFGYEISERYKTMPQVFRENGYVTFGTGKNEPGKHGHFNRSFSTGDNILFKGMTRDQSKLRLFSYSQTGDYSNKNVEVHENKFSADVYADACIKFLEAQQEADKPFFAYVAFQTPHDPRQAPAVYHDSYDANTMKPPVPFMPEHPFDNGMLRIRDENLAPFPRTEPVVRKHLADYYATISHTDDQIGRVLEALKKTGKANDTIVVFCADNGLAIGSHGLMGKQNIYEHSVRVPMVIMGPGIPKGEIREQLCYMYDIYPTLCDRAGLKTPATVQYRSLTKAIDNSKSKHRDHLYFAFMSWQRSVRDQQYKLIEYCVGDERHTQLFDLAADPQETKNLADHKAHQVTVSRLRILLKQERVRLNDGNTPYELTNKQGVDFWTAFEKD